MLSRPSSGRVHTVVNNVGQYAHLSKAAGTSSAATDSFTTVNGEQEILLAPTSLLVFNGVDMTLTHKIRLVDIVGIHPKDDGTSCKIEWRHDGLCNPHQQREEDNEDDDQEEDEELTFQFDSNDTQENFRSKLLEHWNHMKTEFSKYLEAVGGGAAPESTDGLSATGAGTALRGADSTAGSVVAPKSESSVATNEKKVTTDIASEIERRRKIQTEYVTSVAVQRAVKIQAYAAEMLRQEAAVVKKTNAATAAPEAQPSAPMQKASTPLISLKELLAKEKNPHGEFWSTPAGLGVLKRAASGDVAKLKFASRRCKAIINDLLGGGFSSSDPDLLILEDECTNFHPLVDAMVNARNSESLQELHFFGLIGIDNTFCARLLAMAPLPNLHTLVIEDCTSISHQGANDLLDLIARSKGLQHLLIRGSTQIPGNVIAKINKQAMQNIVLGALR